MVGLLFLKLDIMVSKIPLCLAKNRDALLCQQGQIYDRIHYSVLLWYWWERCRYVTDKQISCFICILLENVTHSVRQ